MALRLYLMPMVTTVINGKTIKQPAYESVLAGRGDRMDLGDEPWVLIVVDLSDAEDALIVANADVTAIAVSTLDTALTGGQANAIQTRLESMNIPAGWVSGGMTRRFLLGKVIRMAQVWQRLEGLRQEGGSLFGGGVTLNSTFSSLSAPVQQFLRDAAASFAVDTAPFTGATTIRVFFKACADTIFPGPIDLLGILF